MLDDLGPYDPKIFVLRDQCGLRILLPRSLKIKTLSNPFCAVERGNADLQVIQKNVDRLERGIFAPLDRGSAYQVRVLREGEISNPYLGFERLCESKFLLNGRRYFRWNCVLRPKSAPAALFSLHAQETFAEREVIWRRMFESIRIDGVASEPGHEPVIADGLEIPEDKIGSLLFIRTDFSDENIWKLICEATQAGESKFLFDYVSNRKNEGLTLTQLRKSCRSRGHLFVFVVDKKAINGPDHSILALDLDSDRKFRLVPGEASAIAANLSIANRCFEEFADAADPDGIFRGFPSN